MVLTKAPAQARQAPPVTPTPRLFLRPAQTSRKAGLLYSLFIRHCLYSSAPFVLSIGLLCKEECEIYDPEMPALASRRAYFVAT